MYINSICDGIGNTPLLEMSNIEDKYSLYSKLTAKLEFMNPTGSAKDRAALFIINDAEEKGLLKKGGTIIEATSGNTGIGLASIGASRGYTVIIVMPDTMSEERRRLLKAYNAQLVLTPGALGMKGAIEKSEQLHASIPNSIIAGQFVNEANVKAHIATTGPEIYNDLEGNVDIFVAGVGSGGTLSGVGKYLKERKPDVKVVAVEPDTSPLLSKGYAGPHGLQGIGANFVPEILDREIIDEIRTVSLDDACKCARELGACEGIFAGISSGAAAYAAIELAKMKENEGKTIVVVLPDSGDRYLSTDLFKE